MIKLVLIMALLSMGGCDDPVFATGTLRLAAAARNDARVSYDLQLVKAVLGEAEGEPQEGKEAVACAIHNRGTLRGVYGLRNPRVLKHLYSRASFDNAVVAVYMAQDQEYCEALIKGAQFWEGTDFPTPYWAKSMKLTAVIGKQKFFRKD